MADLPAYSGPGGDCPKCGAGGVLTGWHHMGGAFGPEKMGRHESPCKIRRDLAKFGGKGEHLCRLCPNCGYGWVEACADSGSGEARRLKSVPGEERARRIRGAQQEGTPPT